MAVEDPSQGVMRSLRLHRYGPPQDVLRLEAAPIPTPAAGAIRIRVQACGLNPADWALCKGLFARNLPRGVGLDVAGVVDAVGEGAAGVRIGDAVLGPANYLDYESAGASDFAILDRWAPAPPGLDVTLAAALPMVVETASRHLDWLGLETGQTLLVSGAGTMIGFGAVQMALMRGARVVATAGETFAGRLRDLGASVTPYGEGMVERVRALAGGAPDLVFDAAPVNLDLAGAPSGGVLAELVEIAGGDPRRVLTCVDFAGAAARGVRSTFGEATAGHDGSMFRQDVLGEFARLAAEGRFTVPISRTFALDDWREALDISQRGLAHGKLVLLPTGAAAPASCAG
jgi:NADPH:quinone reductase-like Zn-dependent oxidoreductase